MQRTIRIDANSMNLEQLKVEISNAQQRPLSGGITSNNMTIHDNGNGQLTLSGDIKITIKVLDLTSTGVYTLNSLMNFTQQTIANKLKGNIFLGGFGFYKYDSNRKKFTNKPYTYTIRYNFNYIVKLTQITMLSQLSGNDFVLAVVDDIRSSFTDKHGKSRKVSGLTNGTGGPAVVSYNDWAKYPYLAVHEFFHTLSLGDIEDNSQKQKLMYHLGGNTGSSISNQELIDVNRYIMSDISNVARGRYTNPGLNTVNKLRTFLNSSSNGFIFNKAKFR